MHTNKHFRTIFFCKVKKEYKCTLVCGSLNKLWFVQTTKCYAALTKNKGVTLSTMYPAVGVGRETQFCIGLW